MPLNNLFSRLLHGALRWRRPEDRIVITWHYHHKNSDIYLLGIFIRNILNKTTKGEPNECWWRLKRLKRKWFGHYINAIDLYLCFNSIHTWHQSNQAISYTSVQFPRDRWANFIVTENLRVLTHKHPFDWLLYINTQNKNKNKQSNRSSESRISWKLNPMIILRDFHACVNAIYWVAIQRNGQQRRCQTSCPW
jgi:hypothetical protein